MSDYYVNHFKEFDFVNNHGYLELKMKDGDSTDWGPSTCEKISNAFEAIGFGNLAIVLPTFRDIELLDEEDVVRIKSEILSPGKCLELFQENNVINRIKTIIPDVLNYFQFLVQKWKDGYFVAITD